MRPRSSRRVDPYLWDWQVATQKMLNDYLPVQGLNNLKIIYFDSNKNLSEDFASETITFVHPVTYISINLYPMYIYVQSQVSNTPGYTTF